MNRKKFLICLVFLFYTLHFAHYTVSYAGPGTTGAQFLKIRPSARALGMASSFGAVSDDVYALHFNPSGLAQLKRGEVTAAYLRYFGDMNYGFIGYAKPFAKSALGFGMTYLIIDNMEKRLTDTTVPYDYFSARDIAITLAYAKKNPYPGIISGLDLGGSVRLIKSEIDQTAAYTASLDLGMLYNVDERFTAAVVLQNISWGIRYIDTTDMLPLNLKFAGAYKAHDNFTIASDIDAYLIDNIFYASLGLEYSPIKQLILRAGYRYGYSAISLGPIVGLGAGIGFRVEDFGLDYAFVPFGELGDTHRISLSIKL